MKNPYRVSLIWYILYGIEYMAYGILLEVQGRHNQAISACKPFK